MSFMRCNCTIPTLRAILCNQRLYFSSDKSTKTQPVVRRRDAKRKELSVYLGKTTHSEPIQAVVNVDEVAQISGVPSEHRDERRVRIYRSARSAAQSGWDSTRAWRVEFDQRQRWENPLTGWASSGDPLSNVSMQLKFASSEDAVEFCEKNHWPYFVDTPQERKIKPKSYGENFHWSKRTRVETK